jgi:2-polyprenyl-3-methyl-5-hydroxy-6-metoxy-1,4-benzoquinol methylase
MSYTPARSQKSEYMDLGPSHYTSEEYQGCLKQLGKIGRLLGGDQMTLNAFKAYTQKPQTILDVGSGGGELTARLAKAYPQAQVLGIDLNSEAVALARKQHCTPQLPNLSFELSNWTQLTGNYDVITSTLVCHHMPDVDLIAFLNWAEKNGRQATIINDLHRHPLAVASFALIAPFLFPNRIILHDGVVSIQRAFIRKDWDHYLSQPGLNRHQWIVQRKMGFRWLVVKSR